MKLLRKLAGALPVGVGVGGRKRDLVFACTDTLFRPFLRDPLVVTRFGVLSIDPEHPPERLLAYVFDNVWRYYRYSELGIYLASLNAPGSVFVDIGANLGMYSLVAKSLGMASILVEPEPRHGSFLARNESIFGTVLQLALSDQAGELPLYYESGNPGATSLFPSSGFTKGSRTIEVRTFAELVESRSLPDSGSVRLIKIDVEGLEAQVIAGMVPVLTGECRPDIWCEVRGDRSGRNGGSFREVCRLLEGKGYGAFESRGGKILPPDFESLPGRGVFDLLFIPGERI